MIKTPDGIMASFFKGALRDQLEHTKRVQEAVDASPAASVRVAVRKARVASRPQA